MLFDLLGSMGDAESFRITLISLLLSLPVIMFSLSLHETAHGYVAWKCGDPTAHNLGRLTLNPIKHLDPIGFLCMMVFGFGWAKPVPVNTRYFNNPKRGMILTAAAGPASNLIMGIISSVISALFMVLTYRGTYSLALYVVYLLFYYCALMNYMLAIFNMIPVPPFDGSRIIMGVLPTNVYFKLMKHERTVMYVLLGLLLLCYYVLDFSPFSYLANLLAYVTQIPFINLFSSILL